MRWFTATLYKPVVYSKDKLGHDVSEDVEESFCILRKAPVKATDEDVEGNRHKTVSRTFLSPCQAFYFEGVSSFQVSGRKYRLEAVTSLENGHSMITGVYDKPEVRHEGEDHCQGLPTA